MKTDKIKHRLIGTKTGNAVLTVRDIIKTIQIGLFAPERVGTEANDILATRIITRICPANKTFVDVGAHIGSIISEVLQNNPSAKITAIEAIPEKVQMLRQKFPLVTFHNCAVGESEGEVSFFINKKKSGYSSLIKPSGIDKKELFEIKIKKKRLDSIVTSDDIEAVKIDVEGTELAVLRGATDIINQNRPIIMFESGPREDKEAGFTKKLLYQYFKKYDYKIIIPNRVAHNDDGLSLNGFIESHLYPQRTINYFAIPIERRIEFRDKVRKILKITV